MEKKESFIAALDQGTSSTRCIIFDSIGSTISRHQVEHEQIYPKPGWVEHDANEIWENCIICIEQALSGANLKASDISAVGITNQRESTMVWNRHTGKPYHNIIVWNDTRTGFICDELSQDGGGDRFKEVTGLPIASYFSATKLMWLLEKVPGLREDANRGEAIFGTLDTWLLWKLTGGMQYATDVTNASRTLLMNIHTLQWDENILRDTGIPRCMLPEIRSSSEVYGQAIGVLDGVPIGGILGDQQSALFGQTCFDVGTAKCTYGTGSFILMNTGESIVPSTHGLLSTVGYKIGSNPCIYALEGSIAYTGSTVQWCRDNLGIISSASDIENLAKSVPDNGGVYFVPAFSGLFAPRWCKSARGVICGLTAYNTKAHLARAILEATAFQVNEVLTAMRVDSNVSLRVLKVDGGMTANALLLQFQADILDTPVMLPKNSETTALGSAFAAGLAVGIWQDQEELRSTWNMQHRYIANISNETRKMLLCGWQKAVERSLHWEEDGNLLAHSKGVIQHSEEEETGKQIKGEGKPKTAGLSLFNWRDVIKITCSVCIGSILGVIISKKRHT